MTGSVSVLKVALFGTASRFTMEALLQLALPGLVGAIVLAQPRRGKSDALMRFKVLRRMSPLEVVARERGIPVITANVANESVVAERLRSIRPDLICVASFPWRISQEISTLAGLGAINVHPSLLPRHRGPLPLFWTYHADDRAAGVTVHHTSENFDAGDIILQESFPLPRAYPVAKLDGDVALRGARLMTSAVEALRRGQAARIAQDESAATYAPRVHPGTPMVRFDEWDVERVWHFLAALSSRYREPLTDKDGLSVPYQGVGGFERSRAGVPGTVEKLDCGWKLNCRSGVILLTKDESRSSVARAEPADLAPKRACNESTRS
jgi:methionyl-tRNA formyltransferase